MTDMCIKQGNIGKQPELIMTPGGTELLAFSIARTLQYKDKPAKTQWYKVKAWGKVGAAVAKLLNTGDEVIVMGTFEAESFGDSDRVDHHIKAHQILIVRSSNTHRQPA